MLFEIVRDPHGAVREGSHRGQDHGSLFGGRRVREDRSPNRPARRVVLSSTQGAPLTVSAELSGFATFRREGILMRAGSTFTVDIELNVGALEETVTVAGESPMVSTGIPTKTLTVEGDLLRAAPISSRRAFSDVLDMAPGVNSRNSDGASGQRMYYFHGTTLFATVIMLEGQPAGTYNDGAAFQIDMGTETIADAEVKLGGVDASAPTGTSVVMNIVAPRGGNV